jgi:hypothetical protein
MKPYAKILAAVLPLVAALAPLLAQAPPAASQPGAEHAMHGGSAMAAGGHMTGAPAAAPGDVNSPEAVIAAYYGALSGPAGKKRDWNRFLSLFYHGARLLPAEGKGHSGKMPHVFTPATYLYDTERQMAATGYTVREVSHRSQSFGKIADVWSVYEARHAAADDKPFVRGINSFQLFFDGSRWYIVGVVWQPETSRLTIPEELVQH